MQKKLCWIFLSIFLCGATLSLTSCGDDDDEDTLNASNLVGTWKMVDHNITPELENPDYVEFLGFFTVTLKSDMTYSSDYGETGTWQLKGNRFYNKWVYRGETGEDSCLFESFNRNQFVAYTMRRIPDGPNGKNYKISTKYIRVK